jgi:hypothetical protein
MIELVTTDGVFRLDGGEWDVTSNIWLVGDDQEVLVIDAAARRGTDHRRDPAVVGSLPSRSRTGTTTTSTRRWRCRTRSTRRSCCTRPTRCSGTTCIRTELPIASSPTATLPGQAPSSVLHTPVTRRAAAASCGAGGHVFSGDTLFCGARAQPGAVTATSRRSSRSIRSPPARDAA